MAIKSKIKKGFLLVLLLMVSFVLSAVNLFSGHRNGKSQAQAQCWTPPAPGGGGGGGGGCIDCIGGGGGSSCY